MKSSTQCAERVWRDVAHRSSTGWFGVLPPVRTQQRASARVNVTRLAANVRVQAQTMRTTLARLEAQGHVTRVRSQSDRRSLEVEISDLGNMRKETNEGLSAER